MACPTVSLDSVVKHFESLPDPRHTRNRHHLLVDVITLAVCGVIVGCEGPTAIVRWAKTKQEWLGQWLELPNGIPSRDCLRRVLSALKPEAFQECLQKWIAECLIGTSEGSHRTIAIDGKTINQDYIKRSKSISPKREKTNCAPCRIGVMKRMKQGTVAWMIGIITWRSCPRISPSRNSGRASRRSAWRSESRKRAMARQVRMCVTSSLAVI
jgi:hypothetical protein